MKKTTIKQVVLIEAHPEDVHDALINARKYAEFTGAKATSQPKLGGRFTFSQP